MPHYSILAIGAVFVVTVAIATWMFIAIGELMEDWLRR